VPPGKKQRPITELRERPLREQGFISAGPAPILWALHQASRDGIVFDVVANFLELRAISNPVVERFVLPKRFAYAAKCDVGTTCGDAFDAASDLDKGHSRFEKHMDVIRHNHISVKFVVAEFGVTMKSSHCTSGNLGIAEPHRTGASHVEMMIGSEEGHIPGGSARALRILARIAGKRIKQAPGNEDCLAFGMPMRQVASVVGHAFGGTVTPDCALYSGALQSRTESINEVTGEDQQRRAGRYEPARPAHAFPFRRTGRDSGRAIHAAGDTIAARGKMRRIAHARKENRLKAVVTGGAGFLGSHLCDRLIAEGWDVLCLDNLVTGVESNCKQLLGNPRFRIARQDVSRYIDVPGPVDYVLHFASPASPVDYLKMPIPTLKVGALGTHNSLGLALAKKAKYFLASTSECYGDPEVSPQPETYWGHVNPIGPRGVYDEAKRYAEAMTMAYHRFHGVDTHIVRIFNTYGPRMRLNDGRALPNFVYQALTGQPITVYGNGKQTRSFCYVSDLIEGIYRLMLSDEHEPTNIGNPEEITILEFAERIRSLLDAKVPIIHNPLPQDDPKQRCPDISKARRILKWEPKVKLEEGLRVTLDYFRTQVPAAASP
jgi:dTDP-glucose 4,6-dehydratase